MKTIKQIDGREPGGRNSELLGDGVLDERIESGRNICDFLSKLQKANDTNDTDTLIRIVGEYFKMKKDDMLTPAAAIVGDDFRAIVSFGGDMKLSAVPAERWPDETSKGLTNDVSDEYRVEGQRVWLPFRDAAARAENDRNDSGLLTKLVSALDKLECINENSRKAMLSVKPILTIDEAAELLTVTKKRFTNIIGEEKSRLGQLPDFVCDAGGTITRRVINTELVKWTMKRKRHPGRPCKTEVRRSI